MGEMISSAVNAIAQAVELFVCAVCGKKFHIFSEQCPACGATGSLKKQPVVTPEENVKQGKAGTERHKKVVIKRKISDDTLKAQTLTLGEKIILKLRRWCRYFIKFPMGTDIVSIDGDRIYCVRKQESNEDTSDYQFFLVIDAPYAILRGIHHYSGVLREFIATLLVSDVCTFKWKSVRDYYEFFADPENRPDDLGEYPDWMTYIYEQVSIFIERMDLDFFISNLDEIAKDPNNKFSSTGQDIIESLKTYFQKVETTNRSIDFIFGTILQELPLGSAERLLLEDLLNSILDQRAWRQHTSITPKDDIFEMLLLAEALKAEEGTPEFRIPKKSDWVFPWTRVDEDGFPIRESRK